MQKIDSIQEFDKLVDSGETFFFLKHSTTCPISGAGYDEFAKFDQNGTDQLYYLTVQDSRELSNYIAEKFHVKHESPQAILFVNSDVAWHASHFKITSKSLAAAKEENVK
ncbi:bacillithiol system redox-active protein YtxJ [Mesobacillus jeotgali]|uniref:bacillithiol system redox-active protein YtxJ n=1 Tax=Mesobacillus jeotgali TaxID=129985 RepID=UPI0009A5B894|nr:bacillithiol system redox-active protein YtxJ [Mesobacillus jeotgali]